MESATAFPRYISCSSAQSTSKLWKASINCSNGSSIRCWVVSSHMDTDFLIQSVSDGLTRGFEIVPRLEVHPELRLHPKEAAQSQGGICRNSSLPMDNLVNATRRHHDGLGQIVLADLHWLQKILEQNLPRMDRRKGALCHLEYDTDV